MKGDPEERAVAVGQYLVRNGATVRAAARIFGVSKSTVWKDQTRLRHLNPGLWAEVRKVLQKKQSRTASARRRGHPLQISARRTMPPSARLHKSLTGCLQGLAPPCHEQYNKGKM